MKEHLMDGGTRRKMKSANNISYNIFTTTGLANYSSSTTAPYHSNNSFIIPSSLDDSLNNDGRYNCINIANWFLEKEPMTLDKLQMLCYYAYAWGWAKNHYKIAKTTFFASNDGPMSKDILDFFEPQKNNLIHPMPDYLTDFDNLTLELLESVWETYGMLTGNALCALSENEAPWKSAHISDPTSNNEISLDLISQYYNTIASKNG